VLGGLVDVPLQQSVHGAAHFPHQNAYPRRRVERGEAPVHGNGAVVVVDFYFAPEQ
jgi:hypothetical protein